MPVQQTRRACKHMGGMQAAVGSRHERLAASAAGGPGSRNPGGMLQVPGCRVAPGSRASREPRFLGPECMAAGSVGDTLQLCSRAGSIG